MIQADNYSLNQLQDLSTDSAYYQAAAPLNNIRDRAIKQAAEALGMQAGLYAESQRINSNLQNHARQLGQIYNFRMLLYKNNILPPVIVQAKNSVNISNSGDTIRLGGQTYNIIKQVRFVSTAPSWRDYLWMNYQKPSLPNQIMLPKTNAERTLWQTNVTSGWKEGEKQALSIFTVSLNRLVRDFKGMVLYKKLLLERMVSPFAMSKKEYGITGNGKKMTIDNQLWHINSKPSLQLHSKLWQPNIITSNS